MSVPDVSDINVCPNFSDKLILDVGVILNLNHSVAQICIENQHLISPTADKCVQKWKLILFDSGAEGWYGWGGQMSEAVEANIDAS